MSESTVQWFVASVNDRSGAAQVTQVGSDRTMTAEQAVASLEGSMSSMGLDNMGWRVVGVVPA